MCNGQSVVDEAKLDQSNKPFNGLPMEKTDLRPAELPPFADPNTLYILDLFNYVFRAYHALPPMTNDSGIPTHVSRGLTVMLEKIFADFSPQNFAVAKESKTPNFRHELYDGYKASRPEMPEDLRQQLAHIEELIEAYQLPTFQKDGFEADDIIATLAQKAKEQSMKVVILSADKDLLQLVDDNAVMFDTYRSKLYGPLETVEKFAVRPDQIRDYLALVGDKVDDVPGVPSVGAKTAAKLLEEFQTIEGIYENIESITRKGTKQKLIDHKDQAELSQKLVSLAMEVDVPSSKEDFVWSGGDFEKLISLFTELGFNTLLKRFQSRLEDTPTEAQSTQVEKTDVRIASSIADVIKFVSDFSGDLLSIFCAIEKEQARTGKWVGMGLADEAGNALYIPIGHIQKEQEAEASEPHPNNLDVKKVLKALLPLLQNKKVTKVSADIKKDLLILSNADVEIAGSTFDIMLGSYLLNAEVRTHDLKTVLERHLGETLPNYDEVTEKERGSQKELAEISIPNVAQYAGQSAAALLRLFGVLHAKLVEETLQALYEEIELPLAHVLFQMEKKGVLVDTAQLKKQSIETAQRIAELEQACMELAGEAFNVASPRQLETILFDKLELPVIKKTKTARSTDHEVLEELSLLHPLPEAILEHRMLSKLKNTYLDALPAAVNEKTGRIHTRYDQAVAATGRLSSNDPNLQNIPIRTEQGRAIRFAFVAPKGCEILSADYSQIELRVLAHLSQDPGLVEAFQKDLDVHARTASALFEVDSDKVDRHQRDQAKTVNFAVIYGQTQFALARNLKISRPDAKKYIDAFFARYAGVKTFMDKVIEEGTEKGEVTTLFGRKRKMPDLKSKNHRIRSAAERVARNTPIQGTAADIIKIAMVRIQNELQTQKLQSNMVLTVHDELLFEVEPSEKTTIEKIVKTEMENAAELSVPLVVGMGWGKSWGAAH